MAEENNAIFAPPRQHDKKGDMIDRINELPKPTRKKHTTIGLDDEDVLDLFHLMYLQRRFEERAMQMYQKGKFGGFLHLYMGQEAVSAGTVYAMNDDDDIITAYRDHGWGLVRGISTKQAMAELYGKKTGCSKGKGGSMHFANVEENFWGGYGIVGGHIPLGGGIAFANKYQDNGRVTACFLGDGAVPQGSFHETLNMSKLWKLPVIYAIENNGYAMGTSVWRHSTGELHERAQAYGMDSTVINGMDVFTVIEKMKEITDTVRDSSEPHLVEIRTYRYRGHSMSDPESYRSKDELNEYKKVDPIERIKKYMKDKDLADDEKIEELENSVEDEVQEAMDFADESDFPDDEDLYKHVYAEDEDAIFHS